MAYYYDRNCHIQKDLRTAREPLECLRSTWRILEQPECHLSRQITINQTITSNTQSQVTLKNIGPGFLHFTQPSESQQLTRFPDSQVVPVSFVPHVNLFLTFPWAKVRDAGATCKLLFIKHLTEIRVVIFTTLKILNALIHNQLRGAHIFNGKSRQSCR